MTLTEELSELAQGSVNRIPADTRKTMTGAIQALASLGILDAAIKCGDIAPDFTLPEARGGRVSLGERLKSGPVILIFYRGQWCPYCNLELRAYERSLAEIEALGASLIAISPQTPDESLTTVQKNELAYDVLSDANSVVSNAYGLTFKLPPALVEIYARFGIDLPVVNGDGKWQLPISATYVIDRERRIVLDHVDTDYKSRLDPADALEALSKAGANQSEFA